MIKENDQAKSRMISSLQFVQGLGNQRANDTLASTMIDLRDSLFTLPLLRRSCKPF